MKNTKKLLMLLLVLVMALSAFGCYDNTPEQEQPLPQTSITYETADDVFESPNTLGAIYSKQSTTFKLWSPTKSKVRLVLAGTTYNMEKIANQNGYTDIYQVVVPGDHNLKEYYFQVAESDSEVYKNVRDPYARMAPPTSPEAGGAVPYKCIVVDTRSIMPDGGEWAARPAMNDRTDAIVYEMSIRDFTISSTSGVSIAKRGTFLGAVEGGTTYTHGTTTVTTGIDHLKDLGVTHVQILPFYDFNSQMYSWGYDPLNYNVPEDNFSLTPFDYENRVYELKTMVNEFHKAGIRVIMDVVYNHIPREEILKDITDEYLFRKNGVPYDLSGAGTTLDGDHPMVRRYIQDSLEYWITEYNIDGFRFDLVGIFSLDAYEDWGMYLNGPQSQYKDRKLLVYGEPWNGYATDPRGEDAVVRMGTLYKIDPDAHVGVFNAKFRELVKGENDNGSWGVVHGAGLNDDGYKQLANSMKGSFVYAANGQVGSNKWDPFFAGAAEQSINYAWAHDNRNAYDKWRLTGLDWHNAAAHTTNMAHAMIMFAQGIPFIHSGDEFGRTKYYNLDGSFAHNSYNAPDRYNEIDWKLKIDNFDNWFAVTRDMIWIRREHPMLRRNTRQDIIGVGNSDQNNGSVVTYYSGYEEHRFVTVHIKNGHSSGDVWGEMLIVIAMQTGGTYNVRFPQGNWQMQFSTVGGRLYGGATYSSNGDSWRTYNEMHRTVQIWSKA